MDLINLMMLFMLVFCGGYAIYCAIKLKIKGYLFSSKFIYPGNCSPADCTDEIGFMQYIIPRLVIFGVLCLAFAVLIVLDEYVGLGLPEWVSLFVLPYVFIPIVIWYMIVQNKASKLFW